MEKTESYKKYIIHRLVEIKSFFSKFNFFQFGFTSCKAEQPLQGMELQEKETQKD